jgi:NADPH-dependent 2,4-dienoyl-CoA reductase/sulfur reductase-like enzyme
MDSSIKEFKGDKSVKSVVLNDGTEIDADMVIIGIGIDPATDLIKGTDIETDKFGGLLCDPFLSTSNKDVFAAGDIVTFPYWPSGDRIRIEHWVVAQDQGSHAAFNMLGKHVPYGRIPFFWTRHYNKSI